MSTSMRFYIAVIFLVSLSIVSTTSAEKIKEEKEYSFYKKGEKKTKRSGNTGKIWKKASVGSDTKKVHIQAKPHRVKEDISIKFGGRVREDYFYYNKPTIFQDGLNDEYAYFRNKLELKWRGTQGIKKYGKPASTFGVKISNYCFWQLNTQYVRMVPTENYLGDLDDVLTGDRHNHETVVPLIYLEDAWFNIHFGTFFDCVKKYPISLQVGYFPYWLGRGLSLGLHEDMALTYGGWGGEGNVTRFPMMPPGILIHGEITKNVTWDFYYNKWREVSNSPTRVWAPFEALVHNNRLDGIGPERGRHQDRDTWVLRMDIKQDHRENGKLYAQPYFAYTRAPEQPIEFKADAKAKLGTFGVMIEYTHKGFRVNVEAASQFGHQRLHCIDRNQTELKKDANGKVCQVYSHIFFDPTTDGVNPIAGGLAPFINNGRFPEKVPVTKVVEDAINLPANRPFGDKGCCPSNIADFNGKKIVDKDGADVRVPFRGAELPIRNSDFLGTPRFRRSYKINYQGFLALGDISYTLDKYPVRFAVAGGYIGGDDFPYNDDSKDRSYNGFIAQRAGYGGLFVQPILMMERLVLARPTNIDLSKFVARNNFRDYTNLQFFGANVSWYPFKDKEKMMIQPNVIAYWEVSRLKKWDINGSHPTRQAEVALIQSEKLEFRGWESACKASKFLGVEANIVLDYYFIKHCKFYFRGYIFIPGDIYKDLQGQPNEFGVRQKRVGEAGPKFIAHGQGCDAMIGFYTGFDYRF